MLKLDKEELRKRAKILEAAIWIEGLVSALLAALLDIDHRNSKTLGNKSSALSLKSKIDLLTDMKSMDKEDAKKYLHFMSIRNQFMHNYSANSFQNCFANLDGLDKKILKLYPQKGDLDIEVRLELAVTELTIDLIFITSNLVEKLKQKIEKDVQPKIQKELLEKLIESIKETSQELNDTGEKSNLGEQLQSKIFGKFSEKVTSQKEE